jgi:hypothetical protein
MMLVVVSTVEMEIKHCIGPSVHHRSNGYNGSVAVDTTQCPAVRSPCLALNTNKVKLLWVKCGVVMTQ